MTQLDLATCKKTNLALLLANLTEISFGSIFEAAL